MRSLLLVGNSHLVAVSDAACGRDRSVETRGSTDFMWRSTGFESHRVDLEDVASGDPAGLHFTMIGAWRPPLLVADEGTDPALADELLAELQQGAATLGAVDQVVSYLGGSEHAIFSLVEHPTPFDVVVEPADTPLTSDGSRQLIPRPVVRRELRGRIDDTVESCRLLVSAFPDAEVVHLLPPPPIADDDYVRERAEVFAVVAAEYGVAPAALRRRVYRLYAEVVHEAMADVGVRVLDAPEAAHDDGYLRPDLWFEATHANHRYGRLVLEQLGVR